MRNPPPFVYLWPGLLYMIPMGLSSAISVRVSNALGANAPLAGARHAAVLVTTPGGFG